MNQLEEQIVRKSIIAIINGDRNVIGTGFYISPEGHALTCYHVAEELESISVLDLNDEVHQATLDTTLSLPECDLAVIKVDATPAYHLTPSLSYNIGDEIWASGYHFFGPSINKPVPTIGRIEGLTAVTFEKSRTYSLNNILRIGGATIEEGISGGPVLSLKNKKAIGIANAKFGSGGGFSMPFSEAILYSASLKSFLLALIEKDKEDVRKGHELLFEELLKLQVRRALDRLTDNEQFLKGYIHPRNNTLKDVWDFLRGTDKIFTLVGSSGVGKTNLLASLAEEQMLHQPVLFLPAYQLAFTDAGLKGDLENELAYILEQERETTLSMSELMSFFQNSAPPITIIVEGFNEVSATSINLRKWIDRTADWIKIRNIRLIISSRPEFWQQYKTAFPKSLFYEKESGDKYTSSILNDFTKEELAGALKLYELPAALSANAKLGHPLLLRLTWALQQKKTAAIQPTSSIQLFSAYIQSKCGDIAKAISASSDQIYASLLTVAQQLEERQELSLALSTYYALMPPQIASALMNENVLTRSETVVRFTFDQLAEYLISETVQLNMTDAEWKNTFAKANYFDHRILPWIIIKHEDDGETVIRQLRTLAEVINGHRDDLLPIFNNIILISKSPSNYLTQITDLYESDTIERSNFMFEYYLSDLINNIVLPTVEKVTLLHSYFLYRDHFPWRVKDWEKLSFKQFIRQNFSDSNNTLALFKDLLLSEPEIVFLALAPW